MRGLYHFRWYWDYSGGQMTNLGAVLVPVDAPALKSEREVTFLFNFFDELRRRVPVAK
jgi:hypothetical protein